MSNNSVPKWLPATAFFVGVVALAAVLILVFTFDTTNSLQSTTIRTVTALGGAAFAMALTGFLSLRLSLPGSGFIVAGGSLGVFIVIYFFTPQVPQIEQSEIDRIRSMTKVDFVSVERDTSVSEQQLEELAATYTLRANLVRNELKDDIRYAKVAEYLEAFSDLHEQHVNAIKAGQLVLAAEILRRIHVLSRDLDRSEFWARHQAETPDVAYSLCADAFAIGDMLPLYTGELAAEAIAKQSGILPDCGRYELTLEQIAMANERYIYKELAFVDYPPIE